MPIADNNTPEGRAKNRRVEIVDLSSDESFKLYLQNKRAKTEYYRPVDNAINVADKQVAEQNVEIKSSQKKSTNSKTIPAKNTQSTQEANKESIKKSQQVEIAVTDNKSNQKNKK